MVHTLIYLALIAYIPGALVFRAPIANRDRRAALPADERAFWAVVISVLLSTTIALGLAAAGGYSLTPEGFRAMTNRPTPIGPASRTRR